MTIVAMFASAPCCRADETASAEAPSTKLDLAAVEADKKPFGAVDSVRLNLLGGYSTDFDGAGWGEAGVGLSWFFLDDVSLDLELLGFGVNQPGNDSYGFNTNVLFRWHFLNRREEGWSIYFDGGAGIMFGSEAVPDNGTNFNFTPQVGFGVSFDVFEDARLLVGARWHHVSNARLSNDNPGRDGLLVYAMLSLQF